jgi:hypothetical protein
MPQLVTPAAARRLQDAIKRFSSSVPAPVSGNWKRLSDAELWAAVLGQISVVGGANSGDLLKAELADDLSDWYQTLRAATPAARLKSIHRRLRSAGVRYVTDSPATCKKSGSATYNFDLLEAYGGPTKYFTELAGVPEEAWRVGIVSDEMQYIRSKGARDLLIGLGLVENAIALDSRLQTVLKNVGVSLPADLATNRVKYKSLELELLEKVCRPCRISGAHFDRILFGKWRAVA